MKHKFLSLLFLSTSVCTAAPDFSGTYECKGFDPYLNKLYTGTIEIVPQNTVYSLKMDYSTGDKLIGTAGLFDQDTLSVVFQDPNDLKKVGLERYSYSKDHSTIEGYWVLLGKDKLGSETCVRIKK